MDDRFTVVPGGFERSEAIRFARSHTTIARIYRHRGGFYSVLVQHGGRVDQYFDPETVETFEGGFPQDSECV